MVMEQIEALPQPRGEDGTPRRVGIEVELAGVDEARIAQIAARFLGGRARKEAPFSHVVEGGELGRIKIVLDTKYRKDADSALVRAGLNLSRGLVPAEIVTDPILPEDIPRLDALLDDLAREGATGTEGALLHGFGTHLNVQVAGARVDDILPVLRTFALAEAALRDDEPVDRARAILPFVAPYPDTLLDLLADPGSDDWTTGQMIAAYLDTAPSRNHALDMLPLFRHLDPAQVEAALGEARAVSPRPAYHYRLPDSRVGDPDWSVAHEWNRWVRIERLAEDRARVAELARAWRAHRDRAVPLHGAWVRRSREILAGTVTT